ncbi:hypothetical protein JTE90_027442 [Oedothorax gibbosus]|uniref:Uncharacterized protein n=1 Tax=Oedothorax gibbosus TaxID=931172 RepID=A0AAV6W4Y6_9ARAC|nr:hypothetical protein JTE90_027442 [Oedothorax gibbosus]
MCIWDLQRPIFLVDEIRTRVASGCLPCGRKVSILIPDLPSFLHPFRQVDVSRIAKENRTFRSPKEGWARFCRTVVD